MIKTREPETETHQGGKDRLKSGINPQGEKTGTQERKGPQKSFERSRLPWLVDDFNGITANVYEAVMVAAHRARQIGRLQKREIDLWNEARPQAQGGDEGDEEEITKPGVDHFFHPKPTIKALQELKGRGLSFKFPGKEEK